MLVNTPNQPSNFITSSRVEINDESQRERESMTSIMTLNLKIQWQGQAYVIIVMLTYMLKEL